MHALDEPTGYLDVEALGQVATPGIAEPAEAFALELEDARDLLGGLRLRLGLGSAPGADGATYSVGAGLLGYALRTPSGRLRVRLTAPATAASAPASPTPAARLAGNALGWARWLDVRDLRGGV